MTKQKIIGVMIASGIMALFLTGYISYFEPRQQSENLDISDNDYLNMSQFTLQSPAFNNGGFIPAKYTCDLPAQAGEKNI